MAEAALAVSIILDREAVNDIDPQGIECKVIRCYATEGGLHMNILNVGTYSPQQCGIASFSKNLRFHSPLLSIAEGILL